MPPAPYARLPPEGQKDLRKVPKIRNKGSDLGFKERNSTCLFNSFLLDELQVIFSTYPVEPHSGVVFCQEKRTKGQVRKGQQETQKDSLRRGRCPAGLAPGWSW